MHTLPSLDIVEVLLATFGHPWMGFRGASRTLVGLWAGWESALVCIASLYSIGFCA